MTERPPLTVPPEMADLLGRVFVHAGNGLPYLVTGFVYISDPDYWVIVYKRINLDDRVCFGDDFGHSWDSFTRPGRFVELKDG